MDVVIKNNKDENRFEMLVDGSLALVDYVSQNKILILTHTKVPKELEGRGCGHKIVNFALNYAQDNGFKVVPQCPFVKRYIDQHKEFKELMSQ
jgi:predicted GNAT family acetyltransferase